MGRGALGAADDGLGDLLSDDFAGELKGPEEEVDGPVWAVASGTRAGDCVGYEGASACFAYTWYIPSVAIQVIAVVDARPPAFR